MKIEVVSGQPGAKINDFFTELLDKNGIYVGDIKQHHFMIYPEYKVANQKVIFDTVRAKVAEYIANNEDLYILTYSDHVLNAARVEIKKHKLQNCKCHQILSDGTDECAWIDEDGHLSHWVDDIFDVWDNALTELLT